MISKFLLASSVLFLSTTAFANGSDTDWQLIPVADQLTIVEEDGSVRTVNPACAFDTIATPAGPVDNSFHFYFREGRKKNKTVVFFNGGGACWDDATCVASLVQGDRPTYNPTVHQANTPIGAGGIFDLDNPLNPFRNWSMVYIPYCSGDIHVGSNDVTYFDVDGSVTGQVGAPFPVKHHGFDNFLAVREWMKGHFSRDTHWGSKKTLKKMFVTGSSAGGYGAVLNFPHLINSFPRAKATLLSDGAAAILSQGFLDTVFSPNGNWNLEDTLDSTIFPTGTLGTFTPSTFYGDLFTRISETYPHSNLAQYTTAYDVVQVQFLKIMTLIDQGVYDPTQWTVTAGDMFFGLWNIMMEANLDDLESTLPNFQYYIGAGTRHTVLTDAFATPDEPEPFYQEDSANGMPFVRWIRRLKRRGHVRSVSYSN